MQFVSAVKELVFEVSFGPGLFVGMTVFEVPTSGPAVEVTKFAMTSLGSGATYFGRFTPEAGKTYVIEKAVYTNMGLTIYDDNYSPGSESICVAPVEIAPGQIIIKKGVAFNNFPFIMLGSDTQEPAEMLTVQGQISKDGGAFVNLTNLVSEIGQGWYKVDLTANEMDADVIALNFTALGADAQCATIPTQE